jgi:hypothetical protein
VALPPLRLEVLMAVVMAPMLDRSQASYICFLGGAVAGRMAQLHDGDKQHTRLVWVDRVDGGPKLPYEYIGDCRLENGWLVALALACGRRVSGHGKGQVTPNQAGG